MEFKQLLSVGRTRSPELDDVGKYLTYYRGENVTEAVNRIFKGYDAVAERGILSTKDFVIAGGACRSWVIGQKPTDIDVYLIGNDYKKLKDSLPNDQRDKPVISTGDHDFINASFVDMEHILSTFDMTVAMCAVDKDQVVCHRDFFSDLASRTIVFENLHNPLGALGRLQKYVKYGFIAPVEQLKALAESINLLDEIDMSDAKVDTITGHFTGTYGGGITFTSDSDVDIPF